MADRFQTKKQDILSRLDFPADEYADASPKGSIDTHVRELVGLINGVSGFVTTSSCSGRIAVFLEGPPNQTSASLAQNEDEAINVVRDSGIVTTSSGGKGGGQWLLTSHDPLELERESDQGAVFAMFGFSSLEETPMPQNMERAQYVHFKFEPMILHIQTESSNHAQQALNAAMAAGFRESGISSLFDRKGRSSNPMVAVRSSGLAMDSIIGFRDSSLESAEICPMVSGSYLRTLVQVANDRFRVNAQRMERFRQAFLEQVGEREKDPSKSILRDSRRYEPADVRKERMRREGLLLQKSLHAAKSYGSESMQSENVETEEVGDDFGLHLL